MSVVCAAVLSVTLTRLGPYLREHLAPPKPLLILFVGVIAPWFGGIYFAYKAARATNKVWIFSFEHEIDFLSRGSLLQTLQIQSKDLRFP